MQYKPLFTAGSKVKDCISKIACEIDTRFFTDDFPVESSDYQAFQSYFEYDYSIPLTFVRYLRREVKIGLVFNTCLLLMSLICIPTKLFEFYYDNPFISLWLTALALLNACIICPKLVILKKTREISEAADSLTRGYLIFRFFKSKLYKANSGISRYIFIVYLSGMPLLWFGRRASDCDVYYSCVFLVATFFIRIVISIFKFNRTFVGSENTDTLLNYLGSLSRKSPSILQPMLYDDYLKKHEDRDPDCSICYETFTEKAVIKQMKCPGGHVYHQRCIDRWLLTSDKCPLCNYSVLHTQSKK